MNDEMVAAARKILESDIVRYELTKYGKPSRQETSHMSKMLRLCASDPDPMEFDLLTGVAADCLRDSGRLPDWLAIFIADILEGKRKRPSRRGPNPLTNWERDYKLCKTTQYIAQGFRLPLYYNNDLSDKTTAAEVVSKASGFKIDLVINAVKKYSSWGG